MQVGEEIKGHCVNTFASQCEKTNYKSTLRDNGEIKKTVDYMIMNFLNIL